MQTWSERFNEYIHRRFGDGAQQKAAFSLKVAPSKISYWCRGASTPRKAVRQRIARWSKGEVPNDIAAPESTIAIAGDDPDDIDAAALHTRPA